MAAVCMPIGSIAGEEDDAVQGGKGWYLEAIEGLLGVGLVGLLHQLCHLLSCAALALLICWIYPVAHTHAC